MDSANASCLRALVGGLQPGIYWARTTAGLHPTTHLLHLPSRQPPSSRPDAETPLALAPHNCVVGGHSTSELAKLILLTPSDPVSVKKTRKKETGNAEWKEPSLLDSISYIRIIRCSCSCQSKLEGLISTSD